VPLGEHKEKKGVFHFYAWGGHSTQKGSDKFGNNDYD
jgi:hypothetical protein